MSPLGLLVLLAVAPPGVQGSAPSPQQIPFNCRPEDISAAGLDCPTQSPCPVYLELNGIDSSASSIVAAGDFHTESATLASVLLSSTDSGKTWTEPFERMPLTTLDHVQFADTEHGWVSGWTGNALPQHPFLLATTDGGKSWRKLPIGDDIDTGSVAHFRFDSPNVGSLIVDTGGGAHHQLFQTIDGGESWELQREADRPIPMPRTSSPPPEPVWRLHADAAAKAYVIEHHATQGWVPVARILLAAGTCSE